MTHQLPFIIYACYIFQLSVLCYINLAGAFLYVVNQIYFHTPTLKLSFFQTLNTVNIFILEL